MTFLCLQFSQAWFFSSNKEDPDLVSVLRGWMVAVSSWSLWCLHLGIQLTLTLWPSVEAEGVCAPSQGLKAWLSAVCLLVVFRGQQHWAVWMWPVHVTCYEELALPILFAAVGTKSARGSVCRPFLWCHSWSLCPRHPPWHQYMHENKRLSSLLSCDLPVFAVNIRNRQLCFGSCFSSLFSLGLRNSPIAKAA